jgi:hypothetical protein
VGDVVLSRGNVEMLKTPFRVVEGRAVPTDGAQTVRVVTDAERLAAKLRADNSDGKLRVATPRDAKGRPMVRSGITLLRVESND